MVGVEGEDGDKGMRAVRYDLSHVVSFGKSRRIERTRDGGWGMNVEAEVIVIFRLGCLICVCGVERKMYLLR